MKKWLSMILALLLVLLAGCGASAYPHTKKEKQLTQQLTGLVLENLRVLDQAAALYQEELTRAQGYLTGKISEEEWRTGLEEAVLQLENTHGAAPSAELLKQCEGSPFSVSELSVLEDTVRLFSEDYANELRFLDGFLYREDADGVFYGLSKLQIYEELSREYLIGFWYGLNEVMLPITEEQTLAAFLDSVQALPRFREISQDWVKDPEEAKRLQDYHYSQMEKLVDETAMTTARMEADLNRMKADYKAWLMETYGITEERAQALLDQMKRIDSKQQLLEVKTQELEDKKAALEDALQELREKFAPLDTDDAGILWGKAKRFAGVKLYPEAIECLRMLGEREDEDFTPALCRAAIRFYEQLPTLERPYGILITAEPPTGSMAPYEVEDIILTANGAPLYDVDTFSAMTEEKASGYQAEVLRAGEDGALTLLTLDIPGDIHFYQIDLVEKILP